MDAALNYYITYNIELHVLFLCYTQGHPKVSEKLRQLLKEWVEGDFKTDAALNLIVQLYNSLRQEGYDFSAPSTDRPKAAPVSNNPNVVSSQQEEDDIAKGMT